MNKYKGDDMNIVELLEIKGLDTSKRIKLVRHQDQRYDVKEFQRKGQLDIYQSYQGYEIFNCDIIVSFLGLEGTKALFYGVFKVGKVSPPGVVPTPKGFPFPEWYQDNVHYELIEIEGYEDLKDRVIIEWGRGAIQWHQWLKKKEIIEILPEGYIGEFPGFLDFIIEFDELKKMIDNPEANKSWLTILTSVAGIYLIVDKITGKQYVGSAYGKHGIIGRWRQYTKNAHGGNKELIKIIEENGKSYASNFSFTILRTLPKTLTRNEVIKIEKLYKDKLGSKAFGLNCN
jgi:hypothetical protein